MSVFDSVIEEKVVYRVKRLQDNIFHYELCGLAWFFDKYCFQQYAVISLLIEHWLYLL